MITCSVNESDFRLGTYVSSLPRSAARQLTSELRDHLPETFCKQNQFELYSVRISIELILPPNSFTYFDLPFLNFQSANRI